MTLDQDALSILAVAAAGIAALALGYALLLARRMRRLRRGFARRLPPTGDGLAGLEWPEQISRDVRALGEELVELRELIARSVQQVGLVRFDAFEDMGGRLSFAAALLDANGDGVVLSSINGRTDTRIYAKPVEAGTSRYNLSAEEEEAIRRALGAVRR